MQGIFPDRQACTVGPRRGDQWEEAAVGRGNNEQGVCSILGVRETRKKRGFIGRVEAPEERERKRRERERDSSERESREERERDEVRTR